MEKMSCSGIIKEGTICRRNRRSQKIQVDNFATGLVERSSFTSGSVTTVNVQITARPEVVHVLPYNFDTATNRAMSRELDRVQFMSRDKFVLETNPVFDKATEEQLIPSNKRLADNQCLIWCRNSRKRNRSVSKPQAHCFTKNDDETWIERVLSPKIIELIEQWTRPVSSRRVAKEMGAIFLYVRTVWAHARIMVGVVLFESANW